MAVKHKWRTAGQKKEGMLTPVRAIREFCKDCMNGSTEEIKKCTCEETCPLFPFRFGKDPSRQRVLSDEQRRAMSDRLKKIRSIKTDNNKSDHQNA